MADDKTPSLRGHFKTANPRLTDEEREVLRSQGLLNADGSLHPDAIAPPPPPKPAFDSVDINQMADQKLLQEVDEAIVQSRGVAAEAPNPELQLEAGLPPPDDFVGPQESVLDLDQLLQKAQEPVPCRRCGYDMRSKFTPPVFTDADKLAFLRHILSADGRFMKTFSALGDSLNVTLRSRTQREDDDILQAVEIAARSNPNMTQGQLMVLLDRYRILTSLAAVGTKGASGRSATLIPLDEVTGSTVTERLTKLEDGVLKGRPSAFFSILASLWLEFENLHSYFISKAHQPDFWPAAT